MCRREEVVKYLGVIKSINIYSGFDILRQFMYVAI